MFALALMLDWDLLQDIGRFQVGAVQHLATMARCLAPFSEDYMPDLLDAYMELACNVVRVQLLASSSTLATPCSGIPGKLIVQLYTLVSGPSLAVSIQPVLQSLVFC